MDRGVRTSPSTEVAAVQIKDFWFQLTADIDPVAADIRADAPLAILKMLHTVMRAGCGEASQAFDLMIQIFDDGYTIHAITPDSLISRHNSFSTPPRKQKHPSFLADLATEFLS